MAYGFAMSLLATREPVYTIGFQYTLHVVPYAFAGALLAIVRFWPVPSTRTLGVTRRAVLCLWALASAVFCMRYGMVGVPHRHFHSGFRHVNLSISPDAQERYREVREMAARIPVDASVTASETLVPHVARREELQTLRYARGGPGEEYESSSFSSPSLASGPRAFRRCSPSGRTCALPTGNTRSFIRNADFLSRSGLVLGHQSLTQSADSAWARSVSVRSA